jgi:hypothetical protein
MDPVMDGFVIVTEGFVLVIDLDNLESGIVTEDGNTLSINPRASVSDRLLIINAAEQNNWTLFQTQLVYSVDKYKNFKNLEYGNEAERRFLAVCSDESGSMYNVIVDVPDSLYLNVAAKNTKEVLEYAGYKVQYILNLDTGGKNIFITRDGDSLKYMADDTIDEATNLIVFYKIE